MTSHHSFSQRLAYNAQLWVLSTSFCSNNYNYVNNEVKRKQTAHTMVSMSNGAAIDSPPNVNALMTAGSAVVVFNGT